ncbi:hypothetical protein ACOBR2_13270 [Telmatobacter bradus]
MRTVKIAVLACLLVATLVSVSSHAKSVASGNPTPLCPAAKCIIR